VSFGATVGCRYVTASECKASRTSANRAGLSLRRTVGAAAVSDEQVPVVTLFAAVEVAIAASDRTDYAEMTYVVGLEPRDRVFADLRVAVTELKSAEEIAAEIARTLTKRTR